MQDDFSIPLSDSENQMPASHAHATIATAWHQIRVLKQEAVRIQQVRSLQFGSLCPYAANSLQHASKDVLTPDL